jgi:hypothetical protein
MALGVAIVGGGIALGVQFTPWYSLLMVGGAGAFVWGYRSSPEASVDREALFQQRLEAATRKGVSLLAYDNERRLREAWDWHNATFDLLNDALADPIQAILFRDAGPNTAKLPEEVRWQQRLPHQVTQLQNLLSSLIPHTLRGDWQP